VLACPDVIGAAADADAGGDLGAERLDGSVVIEPDHQLGAVGRRNPQDEIMTVVMLRLPLTLGLAGRLVLSSDGLKVVPLARTVVPGS
jgi:hypothetical protein